ncbi:MAG: glutamate--tRNA ligase [Myxococcota bacterium]|nr:glutamate--tRNA ligase [Myxococcota bacterium]
METRCRFAPSPTGKLHVGGARSALFNVLFAKATGGKFVLRLEDTDQVRSSEESAQSIMEDLRWLGLEWDEGPEKGGPGAPYRQSQRLEVYREYLERMVESGQAYEAWETSEELTALRQAAEAEKRGFVYRRQHYSDEEIERFKSEGRTPVLRCVGSSEDIHFDDEILGPIRVPAEDMDDFVIRKADGYPTYHFAVVVDDHHMGVTHVLRAQEHLKNTARHIQLYKQLGWEPPHHGHMPLIFSMTGGKMSKRDKAKVARAAVREAEASREELAATLGISADELQRFMKKKSDDMNIVLGVAEALGLALPEIDVMDFRQSGYLPEALVNFLALLGWNPGDDREILSWSELVESFTLSRMGKTAAKFDREKLEWMNGMYLRATTVERAVEAMKDYASLNAARWSGESEQRLLALAGLFKDRATTIRGLNELVSWVYAAPESYGPAKSVKKFLLRNEQQGLNVLAALETVLGSVAVWNTEELERVLTAFCEAECEGKLGSIAQPLRIAVTGTPVSPPIFDSLAILSQEEVVGRISACVAHFRS